MLPTRSIDCTVFQGRTGDHNDLAMPGAGAVGMALARRVGTAPVTIGTPEPATRADWRAQLELARPALTQLQSRIADVLSRGALSITTMGRCAAAMATLPAVVQHNPDVCIVWFDAHADLNTPEASTTGYLGGLALAAPAGLWNSGLGQGVELGQIILVGQRDLDPFESDLIAKHGIPHITPGVNLTTELRVAIAGRPVYVHLDCDVLTPGIVPTDYSVEGGLSLADLHVCCSVIADHFFIGLEIAEFQIAWTNGGDPVSPEPLLAALEPLLGPAATLPTT